MAYLVAAYLIIWSASFIFILSMVRRQRALRNEIDMLKEMTHERPAPAEPVGLQGLSGNPVSPLR